MLSNVSLVISIGKLCQSLMESILWWHRGKQAVLVFSCCGCRQSSAAEPALSVVVPDLFSLFSPKLNLKQGLLSDPEGYMFVLIKTMSPMDKDVNVGSSWGWGRVFFFIGCRSVLLRWHSTHCLCENTHRIKVLQPLFDCDRMVDCQLKCTPFIPAQFPVAVSFDSPLPHN